MMNEFFTSRVLESLDEADFEERGLSKSTIETELDDSIKNLVKGNKYTTNQVGDGTLFYEVVKKTFNTDYLLKNINDQDRVSKMYEVVSNKNKMLDNVDDSSSYLTTLFNMIIPNGGIQELTNLYTEWTKINKSIVIEETTKKRSFIPPALLLFGVGGLSWLAFYANKDTTTKDVNLGKPQVNLFGHSFDKPFSEDVIQQETVDGPLKKYTSYFIIAAIIVFIIFAIVLYLRQSKKEVKINNRDSIDSKDELTYLKNVMLLSIMYQDKLWG